MRLPILTVLLLFAALASTGCVAISARAVGTREPPVFKGVSIATEKIADDRVRLLPRVAYAFDLPLTFVVDVLAVPFDLLFGPSRKPKPADAPTQSK